MRDRLDDGVALFNAGRYFEAHEAFEDLWRAASGDLRHLYQGIVQACAGLVKHRRGQAEPAVTLIRRGLDHLARAAPGCRTASGIDIDALEADLRRALAALAGRERFEPPAMRRQRDL